MLEVVVGLVLITMMTKTTIRRMVLIMMKIRIDDSNN